MTLSLNVYFQWTYSWYIHHQYSTWSHHVKILPKKKSQCLGIQSRLKHYFLWRARHASFNCLIRNKIAHISVVNESSKIVLVALVNKSTDDCLNCHLAPHLHDTVVVEDHSLGLLVCCTLYVWDKVTGVFFTDCYISERIVNTNCALETALHSPESGVGQGILERRGRKECPAVGLDLVRQLS